MDLYIITNRSEFNNSIKVSKLQLKLNALIEELNKRTLPDNIVLSFNALISEVNNYEGDKSGYIRKLRKVRFYIIRTCEKELKLVPRNLYMVRWMSIGLSAFGVPLGVIYGMLMDNMGFIGVGIGIGMTIGLSVGAGMDKKAKKEGRQLDVDMQ